MAENQPPANVYAPHDSAIQDCSLALSNLRGSNGSGNGRARGPPPVQRLLEIECGLRATAEKKLATAQKKVEHVIDIRDRAREALAKSQAEVKKLKDTNKSDKAENKRKLDEQRASSKTELANHKSNANTALLEKKNALREMTAEKVALQKKFDKGDKAFVTLEKQQETLQSKLHQVNSSENSLLSTRTELQKEIKTLKRHVNRLEKASNEQLESKQAHELGIQALKNEYKKIELEAAHTKLECKTKAPISKTSAAALSLEGRMELETHKVECKRRSKDDDLARDKMKRDLKSQTLQSNFGFTTNMMQQQTNATGGMWKQGSQGVQDVSG
jgi:DNA repair exonuclease SbcCD ATPase subunit